MVNLLDKYAAGYSILIAVLLESLAVSWFYGEYIMLVIGGCIIITVDEYIVIVSAAYKRIIVSECIIIAEVQCAKSNNLWY